MIRKRIWKPPVRSGADARSGIVTLPPDVEVAEIRASNLDIIIESGATG